tara:strand:+ start:250 stop:1710 length:1461 start_codon:yes stop_codon:yes gene_type:complete
MSEEVDKAITRRYNLAQKLGKGAYGIVWKGTDLKTKEVVAVKKVFDAFQNSTDAQRTFREVRAPPHMLGRRKPWSPQPRSWRGDADACTPSVWQVVFLQQMADHDNIVKLCGAFKVSCSLPLSTQHAATRRCGPSEPIPALTHRTRRPHACGCHMCDRPKTIRTCTSSSSSWRRTCTRCAPRLCCIRCPPRLVAPRRASSRLLAPPRASPRRTHAASSHHRCDATSQVIRANILQDLHKKYIMYQCFKALWYMHSAELIHRDLKPANLLLNSECLCKIADFGLARSLQQSPQMNVLTDYVATRWYRAPEILLGSTTYGKAVDMWSMGCIFGEMLCGKPLFTGASTLNQLELVVEVMGTPSAAEVTAMDSQYAKTMLDSLQQPARVIGWRGRIRNGADDVSLDMLSKLMKYDPNARMTAEQGIRHKYCQQFYDPAGQTKRSIVPVAPATVNIPIDDNDKKTTALYRAKLYESIGLKKAGNKWINPPP